MCLTASDRQMLYSGRPRNGHDNNEALPLLPYLEDVCTCAIREINFKVDSDDVQEVVDSYSQELTIDELIEMYEQDVEELESIDPVQSKD
ncbi:hypothetical protein TNCV_3311971 [Trichonephila clavipes]|nr:hypothetical protein TNCV_3311971 [Trichonephila clavipes]